MDVFFGIMSGLVMGLIFGTLSEQRDCADAAVADKPPVWWQCAILKAKARNGKP